MKIKMKNFSMYYRLGFLSRGIVRLSTKTNTPKTIEVDYLNTAMCDLVEIGKLNDGHIAVNFVYRGKNDDVRYKLYTKNLSEVEEMFDKFFSD